jgi:hypothetical protein
MTAQGTVYRYNPYAPVPAGLTPGGQMPPPATPYNQMVQVDVTTMGAHMQAMTIGPSSPADQPPPFTPHVYTYVVPRMNDQQPPSGQPSPGHQVFVPVQPQYSRTPFAFISAVHTFDAVHGGVPIHYQQQPMATGSVQCYMPTGTTQVICSPSTMDDHSQVANGYGQGHGSCVQVSYAPTGGAYHTYSTVSGHVAHYAPVPSSDRVSNGLSSRFSQRRAQHAFAFSRFVVRPDVRKDGRRDDGQLIWKDLHGSHDELINCTLCAQSTIVGCRAFALGQQRSPAWLDSHGAR